MRANIDGVVFGVRELAARLMPNGGSIVATASLAGLDGDAARSDLRADEARRRRLRAQRRAAARGARDPHQRALPRLHRHADRRRTSCATCIDVPLMEPSFVAEAAMQALNDEETGRAWVVQPNRVVPFRFPNIPGPR